jgi:plasmid stabilization system protein ParE
MANMKIRELKPAELDIDSIVSFIGNSSPRSALKWLDAYDERVSQLKTFPYLGQTVDPQFLRTMNDGLRFLSFDQYIIFYYVGEKEIYISRVLHKKRDLKGLLMTYEVLPYKE